MLLLQCRPSVERFVIFYKTKLFSFHQRITLSLEIPLKAALEPIPSSSRENAPSSLGDIKSKRTAGSWTEAPAFAVLSRSESLWGGSRILLDPGRLFSNLSLSNSRFSSFLSCKSCLSRLRSVVTWEKKRNWKTLYETPFHLRVKENIQKTRGGYFCKTTLNQKTIY